MAYHIYIGILLIINTMDGSIRDEMINECENSYVDAPFYHQEKGKANKKMEEYKDCGTDITQNINLDVSLSDIDSCSSKMEKKLSLAAWIDGCPFLLPSVPEDDKISLNVSTNTKKKRKRSKKVMTLPLKKKKPIEELRHEISTLIDDYGLAWPAIYSRVDPRNRKRAYYVFNRMKTEQFSRIKNDPLVLPIDKMNHDAGFQVLKTQKAMLLQSLAELDHILKGRANQN